MAQQTAVEWLEEQLNKWSGGKFYLPPNLFEKAKEIEKKQIIEAAKINLWCAIGDGSDQPEQYYNETYGGQGSTDTITSPNTQNK